MGHDFNIAEVEHTQGFLDDWISETWILILLVNGYQGNIDNIFIQTKVRRTVTDWT